MSVRICPRCSTLIESRSAIFCYNCGQELSRASIPSGGLASASSYSKSSKKAISQRVTIFFLVLLTSVLTVLLFASFVYFGAFKTENYKAIIRPSSNEFVSTVSALPISPFGFGKQNFTSITPNSVDLYLESSNPKLFLERVLSAGDKKILESKVGLNLDEITSFFEPEFAYVESSSSAAVLGVGKDLEFLSNRSTKLSGEKVKTLVLDQFFIVSSSDDLLRGIENAYKKVTIPLSLTAKFQETVKHLPTSGQVLIYSESLDSTLAAFKYYFGSKLNLAVASLSGTSFVINGVSGSTVIKGLNAN